MPSIHVSKNVFIEKKPKDIFPLINDFHHWPKWSPWLLADKKADLKIDPDGQFYSWNGAITGSGDMKICSKEKNQSVTYELNFYKPWKSHAVVQFLLTEKKGGTDVNWTMKSKLPFYLFWMKKSMEVFVGMDYERGLLLLKDYAEHGTTFSAIEFDGIKTFERTSFIGLHRKCLFEEFDHLMTTDFQSLMPYVMEHHRNQIHGAPFSIYHRFDPINNKVEYTAGVPIKNKFMGLRKNLFFGELPKMKVYSMTHTGPYRHLGNIWSAQMMHQRAKKFQSKKGEHPFEVYLNSPTDTPENELKTSVMFPVI